MLMVAVKCSHNKSSFTITLISKAEAPANKNDFTIVHLITKEITLGRTPFNGLTSDVNGKLIHDNEQLKRWKKHITTILNSIRTAPRNRS